MTKKPKRPGWTPEQAGDEFTTTIIPGAPDSPTARPSEAPKRKQLSIREYADGVLAGDRTILARAITLVESNSPGHRDQASELLSALLPHAGKSMRIGITGAPGVGKSSLIESLGNHLIDNRGKRLAVLAIDPSSTVTRGSILGDKTRMETLARNENCFIRPSPSGGTLGGVARKSRETVILCEAAGFDTILIETVGVGQSEVTVRSMVDFFLLVMIAGAGDELQGIKRGVMELADALVFNKAEGEGLRRAEMAKVEFERALHYMQPATPNWTSPVLLSSAHTGEGVAELAEVFERFVREMEGTGELASRRKLQTISWVHSLVDEHLRARFFGNEIIKKLLPSIEDSVASGKLPVGTAVDRLIKEFENS